MTTASKGKALITGATTPMGAIYADRLARRGYDLILVARNGERLAMIADRIERETGRCAVALAADLADESDLADLEAGLRHSQTITMLVNIPPMDLTASTLGLAVARRLTDAAVVGFGGRGHGTIVMLGSLAYPLTLGLSRFLRGAVTGKGIGIQTVLLDDPHRMTSGSDAMSPEDMVDDALAGLDQGECVTIPGRRENRHRSSVKPAHREPSSNARPSARDLLDAVA